jgi:N-dimethylarginine dimethylaminohydrolase
MYLRVDVPVLYTANPSVAAAAQRCGVKIVEAKRNQVSCTMHKLHCLGSQKRE